MAILNLLSPFNTLWLLSVCWLIMPRKLLWLPSSPTIKYNRNASFRERTRQVGLTDLAIKSRKSQYLQPLVWQKQMMEFSRLSASCSKKSQAQGWVWTAADASPPVLLSDVGHNCNYIKVHLKPHVCINHPPTAHLSWLFSPARQPRGADIHSIPLAEKAVWLQRSYCECKTWQKIYQTEIFDASNIYFYTVWCRFAEEMSCWLYHPSIIHLFPDCNRIICCISFHFCA